MPMRKMCAVLVTAALALTITSCGQGKRDTDTIKIGAIFAVTGGASFLGAPAARTAQMLVDELNEQGGIDGRTIQLLLKDSQGDPERAISFARQLIEEEQVFAIIGPSTSGETMAIKNICEEAQTLLISCAAAEVIVDPVASHVFKTPQKDSQAARKIFETMQQLAISNIGVICGNTGFGTAGRDQLERLAPEYGITILVTEVYDKAATDLSGVLTKLKARNVQAVVNWSIVPAQSIVARNMAQIALNVPLFQSHGFGNIRYAREAGEAGEGIIFPAGHLLIAEHLDDDHPQKGVLLKYKNDYEERFNEDVSAFGGYAHDALMILVSAIRSVGPDRARVRDAIENMQGFVGISGIFNFSPQDHNGLGMDAFEVLTIQNGKMVSWEG